LNGKSSGADLDGSPSGGQKRPVLERQEVWERYQAASEARRGKCLLRAIRRLLKMMLGVTFEVG
jgi:hypothetical protein